MKKISQADLKKMEAEGGKVTRTPPKRKMGAAMSTGKLGDDTKFKPKPAKKEVGMASMGASMKHMEAQAKATTQVIAHNSAVLEDFRKELKTVVEKIQEKVPYVFDIERGKDMLLDRIIATPQLK